MSDPRPLAFFVYGTLKHDQLGFRQIKDLVDHYEPATLRDHALYIRDGLPGLVEVKGRSVTGELIHADNLHWSELCQRIEQFEPVKLYEPASVEAIGTTSGRISARTHLFRRDDLGNPIPWDKPVWTLADDPLFRYGFPQLLERISISAPAAAKLVDSDESRFWTHYLPALGDFFSLTTVLERCAILVNGPGSTISQNLKELGKLDEALDAVSQVPNPQLNAVYRSDNLDLVHWTPNKAWAFWYQVRSNAVHRGKTAFRDGPIVASASTGLGIAMCHFLDATVVGLREGWAEAYPNGPRPLEIAAAMAEAETATATDRWEDEDGDF